MLRASAVRVEGRWGNDRDTVSVGVRAVPNGSGKRGDAGMRDGGGRTPDVGPILEVGQSCDA